MDNAPLGSENSSRGHTSRPENLEPEAKRRKIRKGTRSCWECKRRKVRCSFALTADTTTCTACQRRGTYCTSQECPEEEPQVRTRGLQVGERFVRVEAMIHKLAKQVGNATPDNDKTPQPELPTPSSPRSELSHGATVEEHLVETPPQGNNSHVKQSYQTPASQSSPPILTALLDLEKYGKLSQKLYAALPSEEDFNILYNTGLVTDVYFHQVNKSPEKNGVEITTGQLAALPSPDTHPVLLAKWMLMFALCIECIPFQLVNGLSEHPRVIAKRLAETAIRLVTTNEDLLEAMESLECIMLEGAFQCNEGNLRRGWLAFRRAIGVAQLMGIHRLNSSAIKSIDPRTATNPQFLWYRIVYFDRFFCLLLGLPQGTTDMSMASAAALANDTPTGQLERIHAVIAGRIIERNECSPSLPDYATTQEIDTELLKAAKRVPAKFWLPPNCDNGAENDIHHIFKETARFVNQLFHYSLLNLLHLPYLLRSGADQKYQYSKMTCVNASREILTRFISYHNVNFALHHCRPTDFFTLMAGMTLLLAYLTGHWNQKKDDFLAHQRLNDRAMIEQVLEFMETISKRNEDALTKGIADRLRGLMIVEDDMAEGRCDNPPEGGKQSVVMSLFLPHFAITRLSTGDSASQEKKGTQLFSQQDGSGDKTDEPCRSARDAQLPLHQEAFDASSFPLEQLYPPTTEQFNMILHQQHSTTGFAAGVDNWTFQGVDTAFLDNVMRGSSLADSNVTESLDWMSGWRHDIGEP